jgi:hypothetical protein
LSALRGALAGVYDGPVRRAISIALLGVIAYLVVAPAAFAGTDSNLPECCRRNGKHHCAMMAQLPAPDTVPTFRPIHTVCGSYPVSTAAPAGAAIALPKGSGSTFAATVIWVETFACCDAQPRTPFTRSRQKRAPPAVL